MELITSSSTEARRFLGHSTDVANVPSVDDFSALVHASLVSRQKSKLPNWK